MLFYLAPLTGARVTQTGLNLKERADTPLISYMLRNIVSEVPDKFPAPSRISQCYLVLAIDSSFYYLSLFQFIAFCFGGLCQIFSIFSIFQASVHVNSFVWQQLPLTYMYMQLTYAKMEKNSKMK